MFFFFFFFFFFWSLSSMVWFHRGILWFLRFCISITFIFDIIIFSKFTDSYWFVIIFILIFLIFLIMSLFVLALTCLIILSSNCFLDFFPHVCLLQSLSASTLFLFSKIFPRSEGYYLLLKFCFSFYLSILSSQLFHPYNDVKRILEILKLI